MSNSGPALAIDNIVDQLKQELARIGAAIAALEGTGRKPGRRAKSKTRKQMSSAARARICAAMKARWAKQKAKAGTKKTA